MSQSFQRFDDCFLLIAASSAERQKSRLQLLCRTLDSLDWRLSSGLLDDSCSRQCFVLLERLHQRPQRRVVVAHKAGESAVPRLAQVVGTVLVCMVVFTFNVSTAATSAGWLCGTVTCRLSRGNGVLDRAVVLRGGRLRALRANFHTLHLIIEAYSEFNNSGSGRVAVQTMSKHNHQRSDLLHACARLVFFGIQCWAKQYFEISQNYFENRILFYFLFSKQF